MLYSTSVRSADVGNRTDLWHSNSWTGQLADNVVLTLQSVYSEFADVCVKSTNTLGTSVMLIRYKKGSKYNDALFLKCFDKKMLLASLSLLNTVKGVANLVILTN